MSADDPAGGVTTPSGDAAGPPVARLGRYTLLERIGIGGMAEVYLAEQDGPQQFKKRVVVKRILPSLAVEPGFVSLFGQEARVAAQMSHANIVQIFDFGEHAVPAHAGWPASTEYFIAMEFIDGMTLHRLATAAWEAGRSVPLDVVLRTLADAARGLHAAHTLKDDDGNLLGLVHRDISPDNLMVGRDGVTKVLDFGIAKAKNLGGPRTDTGNIRGKLPFLAPEQVEGTAVDARCDLWALGVAAFWLLTGKRPFDRETAFLTMKAILNEAPPSLASLDAQVPHALEALVASLLQKDPGRRPPSAAEVADALEELTQPGTGSGRRTTEAFVAEILSLPPDAAGAFDAAPGAAGRVPTRPEDAAKQLDSPGAVKLEGGAQHDDAPRGAPVDAPAPAVAEASVMSSPTPGPAVHEAGAGEAATRVSPPSWSGKDAPHPVVAALVRPQESRVVGLVLAMAGLLLIPAGWMVWHMATALEPTAPTATPDPPLAPGEPTSPPRAPVAPAHAALETSPPNALATNATPTSDHGTDRVRADAPAQAGANASDAKRAADDSDLRSPPVSPPPSAAPPPPADARRDAAASAPKEPARAKQPEARTNAILVRARAPARIRWKLEDGTRLGKGTTSLTLPRGVTHVVADDPTRNKRHPLAIVDGQVSYTTVPAGTLRVKQLEGHEVYLEHELIDGTRPVRVAEGTYRMSVKRRNREVFTRTLHVKAGQHVVFDAAAR